MLVVRCKSCGKELNSNDGRLQCCGCPNMTSIIDNKIDLILDLSYVVESVTLLYRSMFNFSLPISVSIFFSDLFKKDSDLI